MPNALSISYGSPYKQLSEEDKNALRLEWEKEKRIREQMNALQDAPVEQPWLDPVDTVTGGLMSLPRGIGNALADMGIDAALGAGLEGYLGNEAENAMFIGKKGLRKLGVNPERDLVGQFSGLWDKGVRAELDSTGNRWAKDIENAPISGIYEKTIHPDRWQSIEAQDIYNAPDIYKAYPDAGGINIEALGSGDVFGAASYNPRGVGRIELNGPARVGGHPGEISGGYRGVQEHELQHAIQKREGFARGGSPEQMAVEWSRAKQNQDFYSTVASLSEVAEDMGGSLDKAAKELSDIGIPIDQEHIDLAINIGGAKRARELADLKLAELKKYGDMGTQYSDSDPGKKLYQRLAGEWEARGAGARATLSPDDPRLGNALDYAGTRFRTGKPFETADDIPLNELIVRMDGGEARSYGDGKWFHGTDRVFDAPDKSMVGDNYPNHSFGVHLTSRPNEAGIYTQRSIDPDGGFKEGANIRRFTAEPKNELVINTDDLSASMYADLNRGEIIEKLVEAKRAGIPHDAVRIVRQRGDEWDGENLIVLDPSILRDYY